MITTLALAVATAAAPAAPSTQAFYVAAIRAMSDLPQPNYVTYRLAGSGSGMKISLTTNSSGVWLAMGFGDGTNTWDVRHRTFDYHSAVDDRDDGKTYYTGRSLFDPTWYGTERALRKGMLGSQDPAPPRNVQAQPTPTAPPTLKTIAITAVMGPSLYAIYDRGSATCANGDPGHALHLVSRDHSWRHQLSDVVVDLHNMRFCMMRYSIPDSFGFHGIVEQHFSDVGGYWMETDGVIDGTLRLFGLSLHHGIWRYKLESMQFPSYTNVDN